LKVTSIGEILFDVYPEEKKLGGAPFNFFYHFNKLTGNGNFISRIGNDINGRNILEFLYTNGISDEYIQIDEKHPTGKVEVKLDENKVPEFQIAPNSAYEYIGYTESVADLLENNTDMLYHGSLAQKGEISLDTMNRIFLAGIKRFCDLNLRQHYYSKELIDSNLNDCSVVKLNEDELEIIIDYMDVGSGSIEDKAKVVKDRYNIELLCITLGSRGSIIVSDKTTHNYAAEAIDVVDTVGAGDAYSSVLCIGYLLNWDIGRINEVSSEFAAAVCGISGAIPADDGFYEKYKDLIGLNK
jgi:fructokinase